MSTFLRLLRHDFTIFNRNKIFLISALVTVAYVFVFKGLSAFGNVDKYLILVIFNDPVLLGLIFVGVLVLFEKNENTIQALAVTPMSFAMYIWSKVAGLTLIAIVCCFAMVFAAHGTSFHYLHFTFGVITTTMMFAFIGFRIVANVESFNQYLLKMVGTVLLVALPFLGLFKIVDDKWFYLFPTQANIDLFTASFDSDFPIARKIYAYLASIIWCVTLYHMALNAITKNFRKL